MKRITGILLCALLLSGCAAKLAPAESESNEAEASAEPTAEVIEPENGKAEGVETEVMRTSFFDFTVNSSSLVNEYEDIHPAEGKTLLVVNLTITSRRAEDATMYDSDFQIQWGGTGENDFAVPVTYESNISGDSMFATEYVLPGNGSLSNNAVYEVPENAPYYDLMFREYFADESLGDDFTVHLKPADERAAS